MSLQERTELVLGTEGVLKLQKAHVIIFGVGGVGGYAAEALARAGVGHLTLIDADCVNDSNRNRQILALTSTIGMPKVEVAAARILDINPACKVETKQLFYTAETADEVELGGADYIIDAIDTVSAKLTLIRRAQEGNLPLICCMGTGNKLYPEKLTFTTVEKTTGCPLARVMRQECRKRGFHQVRVLYSTEESHRAKATVPDTEGTGRHAPGSVSFVPGVAGLMLAGEIVREISGVK
ncbi:MAG: tRNA threonylcarbamoyladenosine dehydratase [Faecalibacterium sp.]